MFRSGLLALAATVVLGTTVGCSTESPAARQYTEMKGLQYVPPPNDYIQRQLKLKESADAKNVDVGKGGTGSTHP